MIFYNAIGIKQSFSYHIRVCGAVRLILIQMALITNKDNFGQTKRHLVINRELNHDVKTAIPIQLLLYPYCILDVIFNRLNLCLSGKSWFLNIADKFLSFSIEFQNISLNCKNALNHVTKSVFLNQNFCSSSHLTLVCYHDIRKRPRNLLKCLKNRSKFMFHDISSFLMEAA